MRKRASSASRSRGFDTGSREEIQGRAGESLPHRQKVVVGNDRDWERAGRDDAEPKKRPRVRRPAATRKKHDKKSVVETAYERGPRSRFQIEGRGARPKLTQRRKR
jgi:hypothetical protein